VQVWHLDELEVKIEDLIKYMKILKLRLMEQMAYQNGLVFVYETYPSPLK